MKRKTNVDVNATFPFNFERFLVDYILLSIYLLFSGLILFVLACFLHSLSDIFALCLLRFFANFEIENNNERKNPRAKHLKTDGRKFSVMNFAVAREYQTSIDTMTSKTIGVGSKNSEAFQS